uniref:MFS domain-containing protein n=1 Tax=Heterorhabditis bacteriophora TaxID=37862 RepID=A0A1I7WZ91_HETBA
MVLHVFGWDASTSVTNLSESQLIELCSHINNGTGRGTLAVAAIATTVIGDTIHRRPPTYLVWGVGLMFVTLINMCAVVGIGVMRYLTKDIYNQVD